MEASDESLMTLREEEWLDGHNNRREKNTINSMARHTVLSNGALG